MKNRVIHAVWVLLLLCAMVFSGPAFAAEDAPAPLSPAETAAQMKLPEGFEATVFAAEPDIVQPIAFTFDERGRMWVVENYSYPGWSKGTRDKIVILEDTDGDGKFDTKKLFWDGGVNLTGIALGHGGVWLCATPNLIFVPDHDRDDRPDGPAEIKLDGWSLDSLHNAFNSLVWGVDGWLYGCNGILSRSMIGPPGTPPEARTPIDCGVWRYHPVLKKFEVVAHGTTNPWGLDYNEYGDLFITNCVIAHLWHVVPGANFQRMFGQSYNPYVYELMATCADHLHWAGGHWTESRGNLPEHDDAGGGHAHVGAMVYLGDNWPDKYRGGLFTCNLHGSRVNHDLLELHKSGYIARHAPDTLHVTDPWYRAISIQYGPDGGVYITDWSDTGECHNYEIADQDTGRIYKVTYGATTPFQGDLASASSEELANLQLHKNDWFVRQARQILQQRALAGDDLTSANQLLHNILQRNGDVTRQLRALWTLNLTQGIDQAGLIGLLKHENPYLRGWAVRLLVDNAVPNAEVIAALQSVAESETSPRVRLELAAALQKFQADQRWEISTSLLRHADDNADPNLPLMLWYAIEPAVPSDTERALGLIATSQVAKPRELTARRLTSLWTQQTGADPNASAASNSSAQSELARLVALLPNVDAATQHDILAGMYTALEGRQNIAMPENWSDIYRQLAQSEQKPVRDQLNRVALIFGDPAAIVNLTQIAASSGVDAAERLEALQSLQNARAPQLFPLLLGLLEDQALRGAALRGLAAFDDKSVPEKILNRFSQLTASEKEDAIGTLTSRVHYASLLLEAVESGKIKSEELSAFAVRQVLSLENPGLTERLTKVWGEVRTPNQDKAAEIARFKGLLRADLLAASDLSRGRAVFTKNCASCHRLFDHGGDIGPDLTGSQRANLDYVLENMLDPSAVVAPNYRMTVVQTDSGRVITGIVLDETDEILVLQTPTERIMIPIDEIEAKRQSPLSMMPEGMLDTLSETDLRALIAYLATPAQVELPAE